MSTEQKGETGPAPRRIVLLAGGKHDAVEVVLAEYAPGEAAGSRLHAELRRLAAEQPGRLVAAEWLGPLGWSRFLWCRG